MFRRALNLSLVFVFAGLFITQPFTSSHAQQQLSWEALTNKQIVQMVRARVPSETIVSKIQTSRCHFDTTPTVLQELEDQGVPAEVIAAMAVAPYGSPVKSKAEIKADPIDQVQTASTSSEEHKAAYESKKADKAEPNEIITTSAPAPALSLPQVTESPSTVIVTEDMAEEIALGLNEKNSILSQYSIIRGTPAANLAQVVFAQLRATAAFQGVPNLPYDVDVIERSDPNAFNTMGGHVFVTSGLAELIGNDLGLWAAVEGHEMAHNIYRHGYKSYRRELELQRQINYWRYRIALGDQSANWGLLAAVTAGKLLNKRFERDDENDADKLGMLMMVEAGYHPDFAINLFRILKARVGEQSKFGALFASHPRFITREEHIRKLYPEAIARFRSLWPDAAMSPGGTPPIIATLTKTSSKKDKATKSVALQLTYTIHNAKNVDVEALFLFSYKGQQVPGNDPAFQAKNGSLMAAKHFTPNSDDESSQLELTIPSSALGTQQHKLKARGCLLRKTQILECSKEFEVSFPND